MIIVGLGNPGKEYENTYHNMGYRVLDALAEKLGKKIKNLECSSLTSVFEKNGEKIVLAKPLTFMNLSGEAVKSLTAKYGKDVLVIYDDIDLPRFRLRIRKSGSAGTHNGMRDIVAKMGTEDVKRIRVGIGREDRELKDYVLSEIQKEDEENFNNTFNRCAELVAAYICDGDFDKLMREGNTAE